MNRFVHVGFHFASGIIKTTALEPAFRQVGDWIRYAGPCWIVWTDKSTEQIYAILKPYLHPDDQFLILSIDQSTKQGWMPKWVWDWLNSKQNVNALGALYQPSPPPQNYLANIFDPPKKR